jgi:hypothetical protein
VLAGVLGLVNLFALLPALAVGILGLRRGSGAGLLGAAVGVALVGYLVVYFAVLPSTVQVGGATRPKPSIVEWFWTGEGASAADIPRYSGLYWRAMGEQVLNAILVLARQPFRVRDVYQYYVQGRFIMLIKGLFLLLALAFVIVLGVIRLSGERVPTERLVSAVRGVGGLTLLLALIVLVAWQGDRQAFYLWTLFWAIVGLGGWLGSYVDEDVRRLSLAAPALVVVLLLFGLMKLATLRSTEYDTERQEAEAFAPGIREGDVMVAATRLAEWLRYYSAAGRAPSTLPAGLTPKPTFKRCSKKCNKRPSAILKQSQQSPASSCGATRSTPTPSKRRGSIPTQRGSNRWARRRNWRATQAARTVGAM